MNNVLALPILDITSKQSKIWFVVEWREPSGETYFEVFNLPSYRDSSATSLAKQGLRTVVYQVVADEGLDRLSVENRIRDNLRINLY